MRKHFGREYLRNTQILAAVDELNYGRMNIWNVIP